MVRIIQDDIKTPKVPKPEPQLQELGHRHHLLLNVVGLLVAENPEQLRGLLEDYSIELSRDCPEEELADTLIYAIGECDVDFNRDLASLILDMTLISAYDGYDLNQIAGQGANILSTVGSGQNADGQKPAGIVGGLANTIGQIGSIISQNIQTHQSQSAGEQARLGIAAHRRQLAEQREAQDHKRNNLMLFLLLTALGVGIIGLITYLKRQSQPIIKPS